jgi:hypothetical protein
MYHSRMRALHVSSTDMNGAVKMRSFFMENTEFTLFHGEVFQSIFDTTDSVFKKCMAFSSAPMTSKDKVGCFGPGCFTASRKRHKNDRKR